MKRDLTTRILAFAAVLLAAPALAGESVQAGDETPAAPIRYAEVGLFSMAGPHVGPGNGDFAGAIGVDFLAGWSHVVAGLQLTLETLGAGAGAGMGPVAGPRFRVGDRLRLELLADAGLNYYAVQDDGSGDLVAVLYPVGSGSVLPSVGLRAGITLVAEGGRPLITLGAMARWVRSAMVEHRPEPWLGSEVVALGGSTVGVYVAFAGVTPAR